MSMTSILPLFSALLDFEPNVEPNEIRKAKKRFDDIDFDTINLDHISQLFKNFPVLIVAIGIIHTSQELIDELSIPIDASTKEMQRFKTNGKYLNRYINSFQDTVQLYKNLDRQNDVEELEEIIRIFEHIKNKATRHKTMQWLITEFIADLLWISYEELFPDLPVSITKTHNDAIRAQSLRRVSIYAKYFDGFDISKEDIYRSILIKLHYLYAQYGNNKGRGNANPNRHIEAIITSLQNKSVEISPSKMKNIYIRGFFSGIAIFDYKKKTDQVDAIDEYFKQLQNSSLTELYQPFHDFFAKQREELLSQLILL